MNVRELARRLGGRVCGRTIYCPGPGHSEQDNSLSVFFGRNGDLVVHSHCGDDWQECRDHVRRLAGLPSWKPSSDPNALRAARIRQRGQERFRLEDERRRREIARSIWEQGIDPRGTIAEEYLRSRALRLDDVAELRFHPECFWRQDDDRPEYAPGRRPTLLAAFRPFDSDEVVAIHRIRVDVPQRWPKTLRKMLGPVRNTAVKLAEVDDTLAIAEGVETAMAANIMGYGPAWALGSALAVANFPVLAGIRCLILLTENNDASRAACACCGERWLRAGREVERVVPEGGDDMNDELMVRAFNG
jgi:putative DNA primase/helicase